MSSIALGVWVAFMKQPDALPGRAPQKNKKNKMKMILLMILKILKILKNMHIIMRDLLTQKCLHKKRLLILDSPEHVESENINLKIGQIMGGPSTNLFQNVIFTS
jgi:hypothetical protein